jgi:VCBS repeat-containing protein
LRNKNAPADKLDENNSVSRFTLVDKKYVYQGGDPYTDTITKATTGSPALATDKDSFHKRWNYWRGNVKLAYTGGNPYETINSALSHLGINATNAKGYESQIGIALRPRSAMSISEGTHLLLANNGIGQVIPGGTAAEDVIQELLAEARNALGFNDGDYTMVIADQPNIPEASPSVVLMASTNPEQQASGRTERIMGECWLVKADGYGQGFSPIITANLWFNVNPEKIESETAEIRILRQPKHGTLEILNPIWAGVNYRPDKGYRGNDTAVLKVKGNGYTVKIHYFFRVVKESGARIYDNKNCIGPVWKISSDSPQTPIDLSSLQRDVVLSALLADASHALAGFADVPGDAIGQTTGEGKGATITLDTNAAGYNWFIDYTPSDNSEFLPTANPNEWIAKASSEAAGKMDMLSVLLHEYGHALGFEHSANSQDFMATTLSPGVRRLPSAEELALMAQLVGEVKGDMADASSNTPDTPQSPLPSVPLGGAFGLALLGRLRSTRYGGWNIAVESATQYEIAANPKLSNTEFAGGQGWSTSGDVRFQDGAATLAETAASQTRLNQVFIVGENDRFLSFTVADTALDDADQAPDDAFEVALLDANTGASLLGGTGLTRNDAFLNLQADGNEHKSQAVTSIRNADGSRTYLVDLAGIPAGTAVNLAFDLIGFGKGAAATSSHLTIRDLRIGVPQTKDDSATLAEDGVTTIAALANDRGWQMSAQQPGFAPIIVDAPVHGQITINADGTFSFAPEKDWHGEDHFGNALKEVPLGDKLSDGHVDSNLATVSLTVTPVNDAPVAAHDAANVGEDGTFAASGNLLAGGRTWAGARGWRAPAALESRRSEAP